MSTRIVDYSATPGSNSTVDSVSIAEGMLPSNVNNAIRAIMSHLKEITDGTAPIGYSTTADATAGPVIELHRDSASPADDDLIGVIQLSGDDDGGNKTVYASIDGQIKDVTDATEDGALLLKASVAGTLTTIATLDAAGLTVVGAISGTTSVASSITVADESSDTTTFPIFSTDATGDIAPKTGSNLTFNSSTGALGATEFVGGGAGITGLSGGVNPNLIINGGFTVNERTYISTTATADGTYMHDRWRSGETDSSYTFSSASPCSPQTITIAANDSIEQVIEGSTVGTAGTHTISWTGTATARAVVNTQTMSGNYAVSPITVTAVLDQVISIQFTGADAAGGSTTATDTGTLGEVKCELGSSATSFEHEPYSETLIKCKRYFERQSFPAGSFTGHAGLQFSTTRTTIGIRFEVEKRTTPSITKTDADWDVWVGPGSNKAVSAITADHISVHACRFDCTHAAGGAANGAGMLASDASARSFDISAEL